MKKYFIYIAIVIIFTSPVWMWLSWQVKGKKELKIVLVDKTSLTPDGIEHRAFNWVLNYEKYCMPNRSLYSITSDYYGFYPEGGKQYKIKSLESFSDDRLLKLANQSDMTYFTDTY